MQNPEISGTEYQQGTLAGYELREYLLEKWNRKCAYCGKDNVPLQIEHILCKAKGGTDRVSNLTLSCRPCNEKKGDQDIREFLAKKPDTLKRILAQAKAPLKDAAAVNATRWALFERLKSSGLSIETGTGGRTKFNRSRQGYPKAHWIDAACVGVSGEQILLDPDLSALSIEAFGHGVRQRCRSDSFGFPRQAAPRQKTFAGFCTGDIVKANIPRGKYTGPYTGRIAIRFRPSFRMKAGNATFDVHLKNLTRIHRADGYAYN